MEKVEIESEEQWMMTMKMMTMKLMIMKDFSEPNK